MPLAMDHGIEPILLAAFPETHTCSPAALDDRSHVGVRIAGMTIGTQELVDIARQISDGAPQTNEGGSPALVPPGAQCDDFQSQPDGRLSAGCK